MIETIKFPLVKIKLPPELLPQANFQTVAQSRNRFSVKMLRGNVNLDPQQGGGPMEQWTLIDFPSLSDDERAHQRQPPGKSYNSLIPRHSNPSRTLQYFRHFMSDNYYFCYHLQFVYRQDEEGKTTVVDKRGKNRFALLKAFTRFRLNHKTDKNQALYFNKKRRENVLASASLPFNPTQQQPQSNREMFMAIAFSQIFKRNIF